jgi:hypothetical protein
MPVPAHVHSPVGSRYLPPRRRRFHPASKLECHLLLAHDLAFLNNGDYERFAGEVVEVKRMLTSLIQKLKADC